VPAHWCRQALFGSLLFFRLDEADVRGLGSTLKLDHNRFY
jgi:hypothetical protein